jgi:hypothetical protein
LEFPVTRAEQIVEAPPDILFVNAHDIDIARDANAHDVSGFDPGFIVETHRI